MAVADYRGTPITALEKAIPDFLIGNGIFDYIGAYPWLSSATEKLNHNIEYMLNHSGRKIASPLVARLLDDTTGVLEASGLMTIGKIVEIRYRRKWEKIWEEISSDDSIMNTVNVIREADNTRTVTYGKTDTLTKAGTESESETYDGVSPRSTSKTITGSYKDMNAGATTRTGSTKVTDKGAITDSVFGFNSLSAVPSSESGPSDSANGTTQETTYPDGGLVDTDTRSTERTYTNYTETTTEIGTKSVQKSFTQRTDTSAITGSDTIGDTGGYTESGYRYNRSADKLDLLSALYDSRVINDFFRVVYNDLDEVLTCPIYM